MMQMTNDEFERCVNDLIAQRVSHRMIVALRDAHVNAYARDQREHVSRDAQIIIERAYASCDAHDAHNHATSNAHD